MKLRTAAAAIAAICGAAVAAPFTFQGELRDAGTPLNGTYDFNVSLWPAALSGVQIGSDLCFDNIVVTNGRFTIVLDFGPVFTGGDRFLELALRADSGLGCGNIAGFSTLGPRIQVTDAPMASFATEAANATVATSAVSAGNTTNLNGQPATFYQNASNLTGTLADTRLSANIPKLNSPTSTFSGAVNATSFSGSGASLTTLNAGSLSAGTVADARLSTNVPLKGGTNSFTGANSFGGLVNLNAGASVAGTVDVSGAGSGLFVRDPFNFSAVARMDWLNDVARLKVGGAGVGSANGLDIQSSGDASLLRVLNNGRIGMGTTAPGARLHVTNGDSGAVASSSSEMVIEDNSTSYLQMLTPDANERGIAFGSPSSGFEGGIYYTNAGGMSLRTGGNAQRLGISPTGDATFTGQINIPSTTRYAMLSGLSFTNTASLSRAGDLIMSGGGASTSTALAPVQLPQGAHVDSITVYGGDSAATNFTVQLVNHIVDPFGAYTTMAAVVSSGSAGAISRWSTSTITDADVDNSSKLYYITLQIPGGTPFQDLSVAGIRITYSVTQPLP